MIAADRSAAAGRLADQATIAGIVALVLTPVLLILLGLWLARVVADPLRQTVKAASEVAAGNFDVRLNDRRRDEFGELAHVFNTMTESLAVSRSELIERADSLERSERHKSELISMVSHEVRTPLSSVLGFTRLLLERDLPEADRQRYLEIVDAEATRLATLVSDFLDARLIEEGRFSLRRRAVRPSLARREQAKVTLGRRREPRRSSSSFPTGRCRIDGDRARSRAGRRQRALERGQVLARRRTITSAQLRHQAMRACGRPTREQGFHWSIAASSSSRSTAVTQQPPASPAPGSGSQCRASRSAGRRAQRSRSRRRS